MNDNQQEVLVNDTTEAITATPITKKPIYKRWWFWVIIAIVAIGLVSNSGKNGTNTNKNDEAVSFTLVAGEAGRYGEMISYNKGTEFEENFYAYYVPAGTYTVTNKGQYMSQFNVYSDSTHISEDGWEEIDEAFLVQVIGIGESITVTVEEGQHIEISEPSVFELKKK